MCDVWTKFIFTMLLTLLLTGVNFETLVGSMNVSLALRSPWYHFGTLIGLGVDATALGCLPKLRQPSNDGFKFPR